MASVYLKRGKFWAQVKKNGDWTSVPTGETDRDLALEYARAYQENLDKAAAAGTAEVLTLRRYVARWLKVREEAGHDWKKDGGKFRNHILPVLGDLELSQVTTPKIRALVHDLRFKQGKANRTARNIYSVLAAAMRDAEKDNLILKSPCTLDDDDLGPVKDKDPEWRDGAVFARHEAEQMISDPRIPLDRQVVYGFGLLAGLRPGEAAALRWRNYDDTLEPLGKLSAALSYSTSYSKTKGTKTDAVRHIPVHPTLAALLLEWRAHGWAKMFGREPTAEDLIVPLPPDVNRRKRTGERFRGTDYTGKRWRNVDQVALGWRKRAMYDTKATFISLLEEDGASMTIIRDRVTHTKARRDAFTGYQRGPRWVETCREVEKLQLRRRTTGLLPEATFDEQSNGYLAPEEGIEAQAMHTQSTPGTANQAERPGLATSCDLGLALLVVSRTTTPGDDE